MRVMKQLDLELEMLPLSHETLSHEVSKQNNLRLRVARKGNIGSLTVS